MLLSRTVVACWWQAMLLWRTVLAVGGRQCCYHELCWLLVAGNDAVADFVGLLLAGNGVKIESVGFPQKCTTLHQHKVD